MTNFWTTFSPDYSQLDSCTLTYYHTLIHMLDLTSAKHILEVGCGTGKLLPEAMNLKSSECTYLATDLTPAMIDQTYKNLKLHLETM